MPYRYPCNMQEPNSVSVAIFFAMIRENVKNQNNSWHLINLDSRTSVGYIRSKEPRTLPVNVMLMMLVFYGFVCSSVGMCMVPPAFQTHAAYMSALLVKGVSVRLIEYQN
jgi:hypothetical protein